MRVIISRWSHAIAKREQEIEQTELDATSYAAYTQAKRKREINGRFNVIT